MNSLDIHKVLEYLPHRYPFLLIDRVTDCVPDQSLTAIKNVTINEPFFQGHFPHRPVMPGVLIIEAMAQACAILTFRSLGTLPNRESVYYFVGIDKARFKRPVEPGTSCASRRPYSARYGASGSSRPALMSATSFARAPN